MEEQESSENSDSAKLNFILESDKLSQIASENGFGNKKKHNYYAQDMINVLEKSGDISHETAKTAKQGVKYRNEITHENVDLPVSEKRSQSFQEAGREISDIIDEYKTEGKWTDIND